MGTAWRGVRRRGIGGVVSILLIALAVGSSAVIFSAADAFLFQRAPYPNAGRLAVFQRSSPVGVIDALMPEEARVLRARTDLFTGWLTHVMGAPVTLQVQGATESFRVQDVQPGLFEALGVLPRWGRPLRIDDERPGNETAVVVAEDIARRLFGDPASAIGQSLGGQPVLRVVGVMPASFHFPTSLEKVWKPLPAGPASIAPTIAVLAPGASWSAADSAIEDLNRSATNRPPGPLGPVRAVPLSSAARDPRAFTNSGAFTASNGSDLFAMLFGAALCLALLVGLNIAGLEFASVLGRARAYAVRRVLGATRWTLLRSSLLESAMLTAAGSLLGLALAMWGSPRLARALPAVIGQVLMNPVDLDARAIGFLTCTAVVTGIIAAFPAAWYVSRPAGAGDLRRHASSLTSSRQHVRWRQALVTAQVGLSVMLLILAGLFIRGYAARLQLRGFDSHNLATIQVTTATGSALGGAAVSAPDDLLARLKSHPDVLSASRTSRLLPIDQRSFQQSHVWIEGRGASAGQVRLVFSSVDASYFETLGIRLIGGRFPLAGDAGGVVVDAGFARRYWPGGDALGARFSLGRESSPGPTPREIVGIVSPIGVRYAESTDIYLGYEAFTAGNAPLNFIVRLASPAALAEVSALARTTASGSSVRSMPLDDRYREIDGDTRMAAGVSAGFGALAWLVAALGLYGLMSSLAHGRTREIAIRIAVGAPRGSVQFLIMRSILHAVAVGIVAGVAGSIAPSRWWNTQVFGVGSTDTSTYAFVSLLIVATAIAATWRPARRATLVNPMASLRSD